MDKENKVAFAKKLLNEGYTQRQISLIIKENSSWVQRVAAKTTYSHIKPERYVTNEFFENNKKTLDTILLYREIPGDGELKNNDISYVKLLKYCGADRAKVRNIYSDRPSKELRNIWFFVQEVDETDFDASQIGLTQNDIADLIV